MNIESDGKRCRATAVVVAATYCPFNINDITETRLWGNIYVSTLFAVTQRTHYQVTCHASIHIQLVESYTSCAHLVPHFDVHVLTLRHTLLISTQQYHRPTFGRLYLRIYMCIYGTHQYMRVSLNQYHRTMKSHTFTVPQEPNYSVLS